MIFHSYPPSAALQPFVQCYLEADCRKIAEPGQNTLFPNGLSGIFFNFGNSGKLIIKEEYSTPRVSVFGQIDQHFTIVHLPGFYSLGVMLQPTILSQLFRIDMQSFTNKAHDGDLLCRELNLLHEQMEATLWVSEKIKLIESYLLRKFLVHTPAPTMVDHALHLIHHQNGISIDRLAQQLSVSQRYLEKQFKSAVGLSPKTYSLIQRFKRMEQQLTSLASIHWHEMPYASEYYDQNHFIKDFKRFTGRTPSGYLLENLEMGRSYLKAK